MPSPQKVSAVAYERCSFTRGSNYRALPGKNWVFWIGGRLREVVAHGGSSVFSFDSPPYLSTRMVLKQHRAGCTTNIYRSLPAEFFLFSLTLLAFFSPGFFLIFTQGDFSCFALFKSKMERCLTVKFSIKRRDMGTNLPVIRDRG